jgi:hypothetical protein
MPSSSGGSSPTVAWRKPSVQSVFAVGNIGGSGLNAELLKAFMSALAAHTAMSTQALNSQHVQRGLRDILLNHAGLWEALRETASGAGG